MKREDGDLGTGLGLSLAPLAGPMETEMGDAAMIA